LPKNIKKIDKAFIAESEQSGSVHVLCGEYDMYEYENGFIMNVKKECVLNHTFKTNLIEGALKTPKELPPKDHRHSIIKPGKYFVGIQQRYDPLKKLWSKVVD